MGRRYVPRHMAETKRSLVALVVVGAMLWSAQPSLHAGGSRLPPFSSSPLPGDLARPHERALGRENRHWDELGRPEYSDAAARQRKADATGVPRLSRGGCSGRHAVHPPARARGAPETTAICGCGGLRRRRAAGGTFHTHPYRADSAGRAVKERGLSAMDSRRSLPRPTSSRW